MSKSRKRKPDLLLQLPRKKIPDKKGKENNTQFLLVTIEAIINELCHILL